MLDCAVSIGEVTLQNPIVAVSGTFGFGREYAPYFDLNQLGAISVKGLTLAPRPGNPPPRIVETPMGMLNSVGLQNPGVHAFLRDEWPWLRQFDRVKIIANISGDSEAQFARLAELLDAVDILELNISCPNVRAGGASFGASAHSAAAVTKAVRAVTKRPLAVKLTPNVTDIAEIAKACQAEGADALSLINTVLGLRLNLDTQKPWFANTVGGLSGPAVLPVALRCVWQVFQAVDIPIIGMGGVFTGENAAEMMLCGASAVGVGTATLVDPLACMKIRDGLCAWAEAKGYQALKALTGVAHRS